MKRADLERLAEEHATREVAGVGTVVSAERIDAFLAGFAAGKEAAAKVAEEHEIAVPTRGGGIATYKAGRAVADAIRQLGEGE